MRACLLLMCGLAGCGAHPVCDPCEATGGGRAAAGGGTATGGGSSGTGGGAAATGGGAPGTGGGTASTGGGSSGTGGGNADGGRFYTTTFPLTENPLAEGGVWTTGKTVGLDWQNPQTANGIAFADDFSSGYTDAIAHLSGFPADQSIQATVHRVSGYTPSSTHEIELLLRFDITAHNARGYELDFWFGGGAVQVVRWEGALNAFTPLGNTTGPGPGSLDEGDVVRATMVGDTIHIYKNGTLVLTCVDSTWTQGQPGLGFFVRCGGTLPNYAWADFTASSL